MQQSMGLCSCTWSVAHLQAVEPVHEPWQGGLPSLAECSLDTLCHLHFAKTHPIYIVLPCITTSAPACLPLAAPW